MEVMMTGTDKSAWESLCRLMESSLMKHKVPGSVMGILQNGEVQIAGFGVTNRDHPLEVTQDTLFQIGSITKTFTGTLIMMLVEQGIIDLDNTVCSYIPGFKVMDEEASNRVTIRQLLTHTSGWFGDFFIDTGKGEDAITRYIEAMAELEQLAPLGEVWSYNNAGFSLAGRVIEVITEKPYEKVLQEMILDPLGLENTFFNPGDLITYRFSVGHLEGKVARPWPLPRSLYPAGGITCSIRDLLTYAQFHMGEGVTKDGERLLSKDSLMRMQMPQVRVWKDEHWGLSWSVNDTYKSRLVSHMGGTMGQVSQLTLVPEENFAVAVLTNAEEGDPVCTEVTRRALREYPGIEITDPEPMEVEEEVLAQYVGTYSMPYSDIHLGMLGGRLICQVMDKIGFPDKDSPPPPISQPFSVGLCEEDRLIVLDGNNKSDKAEIIRLEDGSIGWLRFGRIHKKIK